jgi:CubicO group peptidase (beta-lactamase class C family)
MTDLERAIEIVECSLLPVQKKPDQPAQKWALAERMKHYKVPGFSVALIDQEEVAWARGYGIIEAGGKDPVTPETIFQAASISKSVVAMMALRLVDQDLLDLDVDVNDVLRSWKVPKSKHTQPRSDGTRPMVTLRRLLLHSAGLSPAHYMGYPVGAPLPTLCQILDGKPPGFPRPVRVKEAPGDEFHYSSGGYMVVQQLIEDVAGQPFARLAKEWIFDPLGMTYSTFDPILPGDSSFRAATAHRRDGTPVLGKWHMYPELAAAGLWSTPSDLARLAVEIIKSYKNESNRVLSAEMTRKMLYPEQNLGRFSNGLAFFLVVEDGKTNFGHPGWNVGFHSLVAGVLETGKGFVWMANGENGQRLGFELDRGLLPVTGWKWEMNAKA